jgi:hypothetical protein
MFITGYSTTPYQLTPWNRVLVEKLIVAQLAKLFHFLCNPNIHYPVHRKPPLERIMGHFNRVPTLIIIYLKIHFNIIRSHMTKFYPFHRVLFLLLGDHKRSYSAKSAYVHFILCVRVCRVFRGASISKAIYTYKNKIKKYPQQNMSKIHINIYPHTYIHTSRSLKGLAVKRKVRRLRYIQSYGAWKGNKNARLSVRGLSLWS